MWRHVWQNIGAQQGKSVPAAAAGEDTIARHRLANDNAAPDPVTTKDDGVQRIEGIGLDVSSTGSSSYCIRDEDPLSAPRSCNAPTPSHEAGGGFGSIRSCG